MPMDRGRRIVRFRRAGRRRDAAASTSSRSSRSTRRRSSCPRRTSCSRRSSLPRSGAPASRTSAAATPASRSRTSKTSTASSTTPTGPSCSSRTQACRRTVGPGRPIGVRSDSTWDVPEPEIGLVLGEAGAITGVTIGNDVSSRSIEGTNPLYLPQAKIYAGACAIGPAVLDPRRLDGAFRDRDADPRRRRRGALRGRDVDRSDAALIRRARRLARPREPCPAGSVLLTGTGLVPPSDFTLEPGHVVEIRVARHRHC